MDKAELRDGPWMAFPCRCTHGCGIYYSVEQILRSPCIVVAGRQYHHDFSFPPASVVGYTPAG